MFKSFFYLRKVNKIISSFMRGKLSGDEASKMLRSLEAENTDEIWYSRFLPPGFWFSHEKGV